MRPDLTPTQIAEIRSLRGTLSAREVGEVYFRNAETIRRIWRGETHVERKTPMPPVTLPPSLDEGADALLRSLTQNTQP